ncbi:histidine phosphatase family protein [Pseudonocardia spinosispora]|uniref:histidine phosphatase family protein n=1 Tax=Pseudonocardia spinosispora TaxID=103441 RepID=UPI00041786D2|nr:histidine phosphatase family protein [Pseudonocardia spinosispora]
MRLILVRHALPHRSSSEPGAVADPALTELGLHQAGRVAEALTREAVDAIYVSPQLRARQTAEPLVRASGLEPTVAPGLAEFDAADRHYVPVHEMVEQDPAAWERLRAGYLPDYVDVEAFGDRVQRTFADIVAAHQGRSTVACFAHAGTINIWLARLLGIARPLAFPLEYTSITRVGVSRDGRHAVRTVNEIGHVLDLLDPRTPVPTT